MEFFKSRGIGVINASAVAMGMVSHTNLLGDQPMVPVYFQFFSWLVLRFPNGTLHTGQSKMLQWKPGISANQKTKTWPSLRFNGSLLKRTSSQHLCQFRYGHWRTYKRVFFGENSFFYDFVEITINNSRSLHKVFKRSPRKMSVTTFDMQPDKTTNERQSQHGVENVQRAKCGWSDEQSGFSWSQGHFRRSR